MRFYTKMFKLITELFCWVFLILGFVSGFCFGSFINRMFMEGKADYMSLVGAIMGLLGTFCTEVLIVAPLMVLFALDSKIKGIDKILNKTDVLE